MRAAQDQLVRARDLLHGASPHVCTLSRRFLRDLAFVGDTVGVAIQCQCSWTMYAAEATAKFGCRLVAQRSTPFPQLLWRACEFLSRATKSRLGLHRMAPRWRTAAWPTDMHPWPVCRTMMCR